MVVCPNATTVNERGRSVLLHGRLFLVNCIVSLFHCTENAYEFDSDHTEKCHVILRTIVCIYLKSMHICPYA